VTDATPGGRKVAIVLFNLGGPDGPDAVRPFLFNLFNDPAIISVPGIVRTPLAALISSRREESAKANYAIMGGGSPLLPETRKQATALEAALGARLAGDEVRCFIAMRYWHPLTDETARAVAAFAPDEIVLLPLYPQFSTTTTQSSAKAWAKVYKGPGRTRTVCCYPQEPGLVEAHARSIVRTHHAMGAPGPLRLLFSAHGLPEKVIAGGDPYQAQVERTCAAVVAQLGPDWATDWDWNTPSKRLGATAAACWSPRSPSSPSMSRPWSNWTMSMPIWRGRSDCRSISGLRRSARTWPLSRVSPRWRSRRWRGPASRRRGRPATAGSSNVPVGRRPHELVFGTL
jgi:ferrochelatase